VRDWRGHPVEGVASRHSALRALASLADTDDTHCVGSVGHWTIPDSTPCPCQSGRSVKECVCWDPVTRQLLPPSVGDLAPPPSSAANPKCYLSVLGGCSGRISGEHFISENVLEQMLSGEVLRVSGMPWQRPGEETEASAASFKTKCLCTKHNSALSPLDEVGGKFFRALNDVDRDFAANGAAGPPVFRALYGADVERWLLKLLAGFLVAKGEHRHPGGGLTPATLRTLLHGSPSLQRPCGLYFLGSAGDEYGGHSGVTVAALRSRKDDTLLGMRVGLRSHPIALCVAPGLTGRGMNYRPGSFAVRFGAKTSGLLLGWLPKAKRPAVTLTWFAGPRRDPPGTSPGS